MTAPEKLFLNTGEPEPVVMLPGRPDSPYLLTCDHAGRYIPASCHNLGLNNEQSRAHIAWDIGAEQVARQVAKVLDAALILQRYSRLLIDCNRPPSVASSIPEVSELTTVPGNLKLTATEREIRRNAIFEPYHQSISTQLEQREKSGQQTILVSVHSFTPVYMGRKRELDFGVLFNRDPRFATLLLDIVAQDSQLTVMANEPYRVSDETDYTIPQHGEMRNIPHVMLEIRNSLIADPEGQQHWAGAIAKWLEQALRQFETSAQNEPGE